MLENLKEFGPMEIGPDMGALFGRKCAILWYHTSVFLVRYPLKNGLAYWTGHLTWAEAREIIPTAVGQRIGNPKSIS